MFDNVSGLDLSLWENETAYMNHVGRCLELIKSGESYELCLATMLECVSPWTGFETYDGSDVDPLVQLYLCLRQSNPAPYAAFFRRSRGVTILSSSPECLVHISVDRTATYRPIKVQSLMERTFRIKTFFSSIGTTVSVCVQDFSKLRTYETVHQLESAVTPQMSSSSSTIGALRTVFPPENVSQ